MLLETIKYRCGLFHFDKHFVRPVCRNVSPFCWSFVENMRQKFAKRTNLCVRENPDNGIIFSSLPSFLSYSCHINTLLNR